MHTKRKTLAIAIAVAMLASGLAFTVPTSAHELGDAKPTAKSPKTTYVGLGIGDHTLICPDTPDSVTVKNPTDGSNAVGPTGDLSPNADPNVCLGGAADTVSQPASAGTPSVPADWSVWISDDVFNAADDNLFPIGAFANLRIGIEQWDTSGETCGGVTYTDVCVEGSDNDKRKTKQVARFAVCGHGETTGISDDFPQKTKGSDDFYIVEKNVFVDGPLFFAFSCVFSESTVGPVANVYNTVKTIWNNNAGCTQGEVCLFNFPSTAATCWQTWQSEAKHQVAPGVAPPGLATVGTIGWENGNSLTCQEATNPGSWIPQQSSLPDTSIENFPVEEDGDPTAGADLLVCQENQARAICEIGESTIEPE